MTHESRDLEAYVDLAGCEGDERERVLRLAPSGYEVVTGWFVLNRLVKAARGEPARALKSDL